MANLSAEVRREVNNGIAGVSRTMEGLDIRLNNLSNHAYQSTHQVCNNNTIQNSQE